MINFGSIPSGAVLPVVFDSYDGGTGASVTLTGLAITDVEIYKGVSMTQRASDAGVVLIDTDGIDIDGITGIHGFSIDTGDNTDAGFYAVGSFFTVVVSAVTIDAQTVNFVAANFRIVPAETIAGISKVDVGAWLGTAAATPATAGIPDVNVKNIDNDAASASGTVTFPNATLASTANITAGTITTVTNLTNAPTAGDLTATMKTSVTTAVPTAAGNAAAVWDMDATGHQTQGTFGQAIGDPVADTNTIYKAVVTDATGANIAADIVAMKVDTAAILVDTGTTLDAALAVVDANVDAILVDTAEIGAAGAGLTAINLPNQTMDIVGNITGNLSGSVGSVTGAVGSVTGNVGGNVTGTVGSVVGAVGSVTGAVGSVTGAVGSVTGAVGSVAANGLSASSLAADAVDEILDEQIGDGTLTMRQALRVLVAGMAGTLSGAATATVTIRNLADSANVVVATVDANGNRSAVTVTP